MLNSVIVVDDEASIRTAVEQWLSLSGFSVQLFARAEECLAHLPRHFPGVIISDVRMPGMDGLSCLKALELTKCETPILVVTALSDEIKRQEVMNHGASEYILKPDLFERLPDLLNQYLPCRKMDQG